MQNHKGIYDKRGMFWIIENECKSAQFRTSNPLSSDDAIGTCLLSKFERSIRPQAYRSSMYRDEYLQDQCHNMCKSMNIIKLSCIIRKSNKIQIKFICYTAKKNYCSYTEFRNMTLPYSDIALLGLDTRHVIFYRNLFSIF